MVAIETEISARTSELELISVQEKIIQDTSEQPVKMKNTKKHR